MHTHASKFLVLLVLWALLAAWFAPRQPAFATVSATTVRFTFAGNGSTTAFSFAHLFHANTDITVIVTTDSSGAQSTKTLNTDYTVTGAGVAAGGTVTFVTAPVSGTTVNLILVPPNTQALDLTNTGPLNAESIETQLDKLTNQVQRLKNVSERSLRLSEGWTLPFDMTLPVTFSAGGAFLVNAGLNGLQVSTLSANAADLAALTGGANTALHFHDSDRARTNHTGTQLRSTISDFLPITAADVADGSLLATDLSPTAGISTTQVLDGTLTTADLSANAGIVGGQLAGNTLDATKLSPTAGITNTQILDGTLVNADHADGQITAVKLSPSAGITVTQLSVTDQRLIGRNGGSGQGQEITLAEPLSFTGTTLQITNVGINGTKVANNSLGLIKLEQLAANRLAGNPTGSTADVISVPLHPSLSFLGASQLGIPTGGVTTTLVLDGTLLNADHADGQLVATKFSPTAGITRTQISQLAGEALTGDQIENGTLSLSDLPSQAVATVLGRGSDAGAAGPPVALTIGAGLTSAGGILAATGGAATINVKEGTITVGGGSFNTVDFSADDFDIAESPSQTATVVLATNSVETAAIEDGTIVNADISAVAAITGTKIASNSIQAHTLSPTAGITGSQIAGNTLDATKLSPTAGITGTQITNLPDTITNVTAATDLGLTATGDQILLNDQLNHLGTTADPTNERDQNYDSTEGILKTKLLVGVSRVAHTFHQVNADTSITGNGADQTLTEATFSLPANVCHDGMTIAFDFGGRFTSGTSAPGVWTFKIVKGSTTLLASTSLTVTTNETQGWSCRGEISGRSATTAAIHMFSFFGANNLGARNFQANATAGAVTFGSSLEDLKLVVNVPTPGAGTNTLTIQSGSWTIR